MTASTGDEGEVKDNYQEQLKQMLQDLAKEKEKDVEKPLPLMNQVKYRPLTLRGGALMETMGKKSYS